MWHKNKHVLRGILAIIIVALALWLSYDLRDNTFALEVVARFGYIGIFTIAAVSGFNIIVPIPAITFMPLFVASGFSSWLVVLTITLGMTFGDIVGYLIGRMGHELASRQSTDKWTDRLRRFREKYRTGPMIFLFAWVSLVPLPNEIIVLPLAFLGFRFSTLIPTVLVGNFVFNTLAALGLINIGIFF